MQTTDTYRHPEPGTRAWHLNTAAASLYYAVNCPTIGHTRDHFLGETVDALRGAREHEIANRLEDIIGSLSAAGQTLTAAGNDIDALLRSANCLVE